MAGITFKNVVKTYVDEQVTVDSSADKLETVLAFIEQPIPIDGKTQKEAESPVCKIYNLNFSFLAISFSSIILKSFSLFK